MSRVALTEFLEARIAERERLARDMAHQALTGATFVRGGGTLLRDLVDPARILAECAANRMMVARMIEGHDGYEWEDFYGQQLLALPYADHPDYDEAWRPYIHPDAGRPILIPPTDGNNS